MPELLLPDVFQRRWRFGEPNKWDHAPKGTEIASPYHCKDIYKIYRQCSSDESHPVWIFMGITEGKNS